MALAQLRQAHRITGRARRLSSQRQGPSITRVWETLSNPSYNPDLRGRPRLSVELRNRKFDPSSRHSLSGQLLARRVLRRVIQTRRDRVQEHSRGNAPSEAEDWLQNLADFCSLGIGPPAFRQRDDRSRLNSPLQPTSQKTF